MFTLYAHSREFKVRQHFMPRTNEQKARRIERGYCAVLPTAEGSLLFFPPRRIKRAADRCDSALPNVRYTSAIQCLTYPAGWLRQAENRLRTQLLSYLQQKQWRWVMKRCERGRECEKRPLEIWTRMIPTRFRCIFKYFHVRAAFLMSFEES